MGRACFPYGGNDDTGMFLIPEEGASVWAEFEGGVVQYPIWIGRLAGQEQSR